MPRQYAAWGFDYLKYDWCSYRRDRGQIRKGPTRADDEIFRQPYLVMRDALAKQDRDIFSAFASTAWETSGNGASRPAAIAGARPET